MADVNSFFSLSNTVRELSEQDLDQTTNYLDVIEAVTRTTYKSIYVIDYQTQGFEYVSDNPLLLCGNTAQEVKAMGYDFYLKHVPQEDLELLLKINTIGFDFYETIPIQERKDYSISYDFHLTNKEGKRILIHQKLTPLFLTEQGKLWKAICFVSLSTQQDAGHITLSKKDGSRTMQYDLSAGCWIEVPKIELTLREREILQYAIRGYAIHEMAEKIHIAPDTVKFHRKKLFEKLGVANIYEAISYATIHKLL